MTGGDALAVADCDVSSVAAVDLSACANGGAPITRTSVHKIVLFMSLSPSYSYRDFLSPSVSEPKQSVGFVIHRA